MEKMLELVKKQIEEHVVQVKKINTPIESWYKIFLNKKNSKGKNLIIIVAEEETLVGYEDCENDFIVDINHLMHFMLNNEEIEEIVETVENAVKKEFQNN